MRKLTRRGFLEGLSISSAYAWASHAFAARRPDNPLAAAEHVLWYREAATSWDTGLPIGNGRLGGMVFAGEGSLRVLINEESFWSGEPRAYHPQDSSLYLDMMRQLLINENGPRADQVVYERFLSKETETYQPLGGVTLFFEGLSETSGFRRALDLRDAVHTSSLESASGAFATETFVSEPDGVMILRIHRGDAPLSFSAALSSPQHGSGRVFDNALLLEVRAPAHVISASVPNANGAVTWDDGASGSGMHATIAITCLEHTGGRVFIRDNALQVEGSTDVTLLLGARTSYAGPDRSPTRDGRDATALALHDLRAARLIGTVGSLRGRHVTAHRSLFDRVELQLKDAEADAPRDLSSKTTDERIYAFSAGHPDPGLSALLFQYGRYLLMASSRPGSLPATTQGIWTHRVRPPAETGWNLTGSLSASYWLAEVAGLSECHEPLFALARRLEKDGTRTAMRVYGVQGWVAHTRVDLWGSTLPDINGTAAAIWKCGAAWLCLEMWQAFQFSRDRAFLQRSYPLLLGASRFFLEHMRNDRDGWLAAYPESSLNREYRLPNGDAAYSTFSPTMNTAIVRELFSATAAAIDILGEDADMRECLLAAADQLRPITISQHTGELLEWPDSSWIAQDLVGAAIAQIWPLMPGTQISPERSPELAAAASRTLTSRSPWTLNPGDEAASHSANAYARLRDGASAHHVLAAHLGGGVQLNLIANNKTAEQSGDTTVTATLSMCAAIAHMLLQSTSEEIYLLPALPPAWSSGTVRGLRAQGGSSVDLTWRRGKATTAVLRATQEGYATVRVPSGQRIRSVNPAPAFTRPASDQARWQVRKGGVYHLVFI